MPDLCRSPALDQLGVQAWRRVAAGKITPRMLSTSAEALLQAARAGVGIGLLPTFVCGEALARGELVSLFPDCECGVLGIYILYPHRTLLPARVRLFIDFLVEAIGGGADRDPWEFRPEV
ncbi:MAG: hypothetical protein H5U22_04070 [Rhizobium sp.]|nr:hypothetical protein [Rhizobium sp.]